MCCPAAVRVRQPEYLQVVPPIVRDAVNQVPEQDHQPSGQGILNTTGQIFGVLKHKQLSFGQKNSHWNTNRSSGFYFYSMCVVLPHGQMRTCAESSFERQNVLQNNGDFTQTFGGESLKQIAQFRQQCFLFVTDRLWFREQFCHRNIQRSGDFFQRFHGRTLKGRAPNVREMQDSYQLAALKFPDSSLLVFESIGCGPPISIAHT